MSDPNIVSSGLSKTVTIDSHRFRIDIYKLETDTTWSLEVVDEKGTSTVWDDQFETDQAAIDEVMGAIEKEGLGAFRESSNVIKFPKG